MRYCLILIALLLAGLPIYAQQQAHIDWGPEYKKSNRRTWYHLIGSDDKHFYVLNNSSKESEIYKYDYKGTLVSTANVDLAYGKLKLSNGNVFELGGEYYVPLTHFNKKEKMVEHYILKFDKGKVSGKHKLVFRSPYGKGIWAFTNLDASDGGSVIVSPNNTHLAFFGSQGSNTKSEALKIAVYTKGMEKVWEELFILDEQDKNIRVEQNYVDNKGNCYISAKVWDREEDKKKGLPTYKFKVYKFSAGGGQEEMVVKLGSDKAPTDSGIFFGDDETVRVGGFYTDRSNPKIRANGVFFASFDGAGKLSFKAHKFDDAFLEDHLSEKLIEKDRGLSSYDIYDLVQFSDGTFSFIAEQNYITVTTSTDADGNVRTTIIYHTNEIIVPRFSSDGSLISLSTIDKAFRSSSPGLTSYAYASDGEDLYLIYSDYKRKSERQDLGKKYKRAVFTDYAKIEKNGDVEITHMFDSRETEKYYYPNMSLNLNNNKLLIYVVKKKMYQFGTLTLK